MEVEYELDQWEWQGTTQRINVDPEDYRGMSDEEIKQAVYRDIREDAESKLHLVYAEEEVAQQILNELQSNTEDED